VRIRERFPLSAVATAVLVGLTSVSIVLSILLASGVRSEQKAMLQERTSLAGLLVSNAFGSFGDNLTYLGETTHPTATDTRAFTDSAKPLLNSMTTIAVLQPDGGTATVIASVGVGLHAGDVVTGDLAALANRAETASGVLPGLIHDGRSRLLGFASKAPGGLVLYESLAYDFTQPIPAGGASNPFSDLTGALYASSTPDPQSLLLADTPKVPIRGMVDQEPVTVGAAHWLIVARSNGPLVGEITADAPWGALGSGLLAAVLAAGIVETLVRRRRYALTLVEQRTTALEDALHRQAELERTEREARQVAEAANRSKSEFLSRMSHELRTPLNAVLGFGQLLQLDELDETQQESVSQIVKGGRHLLGLINDVLDISRIETGNLSLSLEPVPIEIVVDEVIGLMRPLADTDAIELRIDQSGLASAYALADHQRLKQVLLNLVSNAIKYNRHGGWVSIGAEPCGDERLRITVSDSGKGIDPADRDKLFVPFERLGAERSNVEGTGVGLALSRRLAEAMGGTLDQAPNETGGSRFWVDLQACTHPVDQVDTDDRRASSAADDSTDFRHRVLYIEDNPSNLYLVERILDRRNDIDLMAAGQARLGLDLAEQHQPSLVLLDLHLPDLDGLQVLAQLRANPATAAIPVIVLSADATPSQIDRLLDAGAKAYLTKPLDVEQLLQAVDEVLAPTETAISSS
jgi:signal transduction histidine kinase/ActR/RegA family two-component response regulator